MPHLLPRSSDVLRFGTAFEAGLIAVAVLMGWLLGVAPFSDWHWRAADAAIGLTASAPMFGLFVLSVHYPVGPLAGLKRFFDEVARPLFEPASVGALALISLLAGVGEELLFRAVLQVALARWMGTAAALAAVSVLFGLAHAISLTYALLAALIGVYLGGLYLATGNVLTAVVTHGVYDFLALVYLARFYWPRQPRPPHPAAALFEPPEAPVTTDP
jgi:hypothetical protein